MSNPPPPTIPGGTPPPPSIPSAPPAPSIPAPPTAPVTPVANGAPAAPVSAAPAAPAAGAAPTIPLRPAGLGGGIKLGGGLKTVALGSATTPLAPPAGATTVPLAPPGAGMATAQLPQATIGLNTAPASSGAVPISSASFTAKKFEQDADEAPNTLLNVLSCVALVFALAFVGYQYATDTLEARTLAGWMGGSDKPAASAPAADKAASSDEADDESSAESTEEAPAEDSAPAADEEE